MDRVQDLLASANTLLTEQLGPFGPLIAVGALGLLLILVTLPVLLKRQRDPLDKLKEAARHGSAYDAGKSIDGKKGSLRASGSGSGDKLAKYSTFLEPQNAVEFSAVKLKLVQAGYRGKNAVRTYYFVQFALGMSMLTIGVIVALVKMATDEPSAQELAITILLPGAIGYYLPKYWVSRRQQSRQEEIVNGFPDSLDMMLVCVEAGQSLDQSILRVSKEIRAGYPALAEEYEIVSQEMKAGKERTAVLRDMGTRAGAADVNSFVTVLIQSSTFGTSIAEALRVYASEMRDKRVMRAEEKANTLPTKLTLVTMMLTVPPLLIILIGPSLHGIAAAFSSM
jgi:tight adherence protein C